jgi:adrenodoxin-NADP+ reductase
MFGVTRLSSTFDPRASAHDTGETLTLDSPLVFRSIGYKAVPLTGFTEAGIQFDDHIGILKNDGQGRVLRLVGESGKAAAVTRHIAGLYCAGWVKRGPTGVIASTMADAFATADAVIHDWLSGRPFLHHGRAHSPQGWEGLKHDTNGANSWRVVHWKDWERIDKVELEMGQRAGKIRRKFTDTAEMLAVLSGS